VRSGAALPVVLFVLAISSALAVGGAYATRQLASSARAAHRGASLEPEAERALVNIVAGWDSAGRADQPVGTTEPIAGSPASSVRTRAWITRISERTYWLVAESSVSVKPMLRRRLGLLVRVTGGLAVAVPLRSWSELP
jgi:hypothetical protein